MKVGPGYHPFHYLPHGLLSGKAHPVTRTLTQGERIGKTQSVQVVETPGHTRGSVSFWVPKSRVVIVGDVLSNASWISLGGLVGLWGGGGKYTQRLAGWSFPPTPREPLKHLCVSPYENKESVQTIMGLRPRIICFGHGEPLCLEELEVEEKEEEGAVA